jgi:rfaE bifunctional protein kinase chain/domain
MNRLNLIVSAFAHQRLVVVGDVFLDDYLIGQPERLSREAPIPILAYKARRQIPGGGANPAMNAAALGAQVSQVGVVGDDPEAAALRQLLSDSKIDVSGLITDATRTTLTKTRLVAEGELRFPQQVARIDKGSRLPLDPATEATLLSAINHLVLASAPSALLVSDYRSGLITPTLADSLRDLARQRNLILTADTQGDLDKYHGFTLVKCNRGEAESFLQRRLDTDDETAQALSELSGRLDVETILITRGSHGLSVGNRHTCTHLPASNLTEVYDVTGAGDTVIAVATLALCAGADPLTAARLANLAAGWVVRKWGNAVVTDSDLKAQILNDTD